MRDQTFVSLLIVDGKLSTIDERPTLGLRFSQVFLSVAILALIGPCFAIEIQFDELMKNPPVNGETRPNGKRRSPIVAPGRNVHSSSRRCRTGRVRPQSHESIGKDARRRRRLSWEIFCQVQPFSSTAALLRRTKEVLLLPGFQKHVRTRSS